MLHSEGKEHTTETGRERSEEEIQQIITKIRYFSPKSPSSEMSEEKMRTLRGSNRNIYTSALGLAIDHIKEYLDITMEGSHQNFAQDLSLDKMNSLDIKNGQLIIRGTMNGTPISFFYNLETGVITSNALVVEDTNKETFSFNKDQQNPKPLVTLSSFSQIVHQSRNTLQANRNQFQRLEQEKDPTQKALQSKEIREHILANTHTVQAESYRKEDFALEIEKNQTMQTIIQLFQLDRYTEYSKKSSPEIYHLLHILDASIHTPLDAQKMRANFSTLSQLITKANTNHTINNDLVLAKHFTVEKEENDRDNLQNANYKDNGLYAFVKHFTSNLDQNSTYFREGQILDHNKMATYLKELNNVLEKSYIYAEGQININLFDGNSQLAYFYGELTKERELKPFEDFPNKPPYNEYRT
ncbi:MAG: hypothetical protein LBU27_09545 [Candidatus Peribacteria bacterium]|jgi:hypothetical protein|nr:hypothetical protein [Candidatus Peribacteria bacterium]